ncbi:ankyrin repeat and SOCS box protein 13 [Serinus canaria]|uniref:ankyrin repeat and SOCS box protein 13 n=1 Tax=Serinus canaria TaxID=9135 RepID=UPI0021CC900B|nr:ankyrin repeat and SOCS box protein 13 [Serinus canaria]
MPGLARSRPSGRPHDRPARPPARRRYRAGGMRRRGAAAAIRRPQEVEGRIGFQWDFPGFHWEFPVFIGHSRCSRAGSPECVQLLIEVGANLEAHDCHFGTPLHVACAREHLDCAKLLLQAGANVNAAKLHETALHHAAKVRNADLVELLVEFGGNIYARDNRGKKPSDYTWSSSPAAKCFEFYEKTPLSLAQLCRLAVRRAAGQRGLAKISQLQIPPRLIQYLSYN